MAEPRIPYLREQLYDRLRSDADFTAFLVDHFPEVARRTSEGMDRAQKINLLFSLAAPDQVAQALNQRPPQDGMPGAAIAAPAAAASPAPLRLAILAAPEDEADGWIRELRIHLVSLLRQKEIKLVDRFDFFQDAQRGFEQAINEADAVLVLVSPALFASRETETLLIKALARSAATDGRVRLLPILLHPVDRSHDPLLHLQALPHNGKPVATWRNRDAAWVEVVQGLRQALPLLRSSTPSARPAVGSVAMGQLRILFISGPSHGVFGALNDATLRYLTMGRLDRSAAERFSFTYKKDLNLGNLSAALESIHPQIVHFHGHSTPAGLLLEAPGQTQQVMPASAFADALTATPGIRCVVLDTEFAMVHGRAVAERVGCCVAIRTNPDPRIRTAFISGFYEALAAGHSVWDAFKLGRTQAALRGSSRLDDELYLFVDPKLDPQQIFIP